VKGRIQTVNLTNGHFVMLRKEENAIFLSV
jgi:hypothetical protein